MNLSEHINHFSVMKSNKLKKIFSPIEDAFGLSYMSFFTLSPKGFSSLLMNRPGFSEYYVDKCIIKDDTLMCHPDSLQEGIVTWSSLLSKRGFKRIHGKINSCFNIVDGVTVISPSDRPNATYEGISLAVPTDNRSALNLFLNEGETLHKIIVYLKQEIQSAFPDLDEAAFDLIKLRGDDFYNKDTIITRLHPSKRAALNALFVDQLTMTEKKKVGALSFREKQCLNLLLEGKSAAKSGAILSLSRRTVEHYLDSVKNKLSCESKADLLYLFRNLKT